MLARSITTLLLFTCAVGSACDGARPTDSGRRFTHGVPLTVFTSLQLVPDAVTMKEGWTAPIEIVALDQKGRRMTLAEGYTISSSNPAVATMHSAGYISSYSAGAAEITVTKTVGDVTLSAVVKTTILPADPSAELILTAHATRGWEPSVAHLIAGGTVLWKTERDVGWSGVPHGMLYLLDKDYTIVDSLDLSAGSVTKTFKVSGTFRYCSAGCWDPPDFGVVHVR